MPVFEEVKLAWGGKEYVIPPNQVMVCIAKVEDVLTLGDLTRAHERNVVPMAKVAIAFGRVLRHVGADVSDEDVYRGMFAGADQKLRAWEAVNLLMAMMMPPDIVKKQLAEEAPSGKVPAAPPAQ